MNDFTDFRSDNGSSQGQNLALSVLCVPYSLDSPVVGSQRHNEHRAAVMNEYGSGFMVEVPRHATKWEFQKPAHLKYFRTIRKS